MKMHSVVLGALLVGASMSGWAHGDAKPVHGGTVQVAADMQYELVPEGGGVALYVVDHDQPADATKMSGKLTVLNGTDKAEAELKPAGGNKLQATALKVAPGSKVVASVKGADGRATTVRFAVK